MPTVAFDLEGDEEDSWWKTREKDNKRRIGKKETISRGKKNKGLKKKLALRGTFIHTVGQVNTPFLDFSQEAKVTIIMMNSSNFQQ